MTQMKSFSSLQAEETQENFPHQIGTVEKSSKKTRTVFILVLILMIGLTIFNFFGPTILSPNQIEQNDVELFPELEPSDDNLETLEVTQKKPIIATNNQRRNGTRYHVPLSAKAKQRISYGQPRPKNTTIRAVIIEKKNKADTNNDVCALTNGVNIITNKSLTTAANLLNIEQVSKWIVFMSAIDEVGDQLINQIQFKPNLLSIKRIKEVVVDSQYEFVANYIKNCQSVIYLQHPFVVSSQNGKKLIEKAKQLKQTLKQGFVGYTKQVEDQKGIKTLEDLSTVDLNEFNEDKTSRYLYIIDTGLFSLMTPLNFVNFNKYTFQHMLIYPILALTQKSKYLVPLEGIYHSYDEVVANFKQFALTQIQLGANTKCFVNYPSIPTQNNIDQIKSYSNALSQVKLTQTAILVVYLVYKFETNQKNVLYSFYEALSQIKKKNSNFNIRIRIVSKKAVSALAAYQCAYAYCPKNSLMVLSRSNIHLQKKISQSLDIVNNAKSHYYFTGNLNLKPNQKLSDVISGQSNGQRFNFQRYLSDFSQIQIFKSEFMKMINLWVLKQDDNNFYETQASFLIPLLQMSGYQVVQLQPLYITAKPRKSTQIQLNELKRLQRYGKWEPIQNNILNPIPYNSLTNLDLRRNHLDQIPKIIHQVWFKQQKIPQNIKNLQDTIVKVNKDYKYMLWKRQNLTEYDFPMSYTFVARTLQYQWAYQKSLHHWVQALISYEVLYNHGGIYLGLNVQAIKPLDSFLKYELFFSGFYSQYGKYQSPISFGRDIIGAKRYSYHMRFVLSELISERTLEYQQPDYEAIVGGDILRTSMTDDQLFTTVGFGFQLFNYDPSRKLLCGETEVPCKQFQQAYIVLHNLI